MQALSKMKSQWMTCSIRRDAFKIKHMHDAMCTAMFKPNCILSKLGRSCLAYRDGLLLLFFGLGLEGVLDIG